MTIKIVIVSEITITMIHQLCEDGKVPQGYHCDPKVVSFLINNLRSSGQQHQAMKKQFKKALLRQTKKSAMHLPSQGVALANVAAH